jgi:DHA1 family bicyclomycin/chloramphenicol resistance-like MFS transporter
VNAFGFGALFSYITGSPLILMEIFSLSAAGYALSFAVSTAGILSGTILNGAASSRGVSGTRLIAIGALLQLTTSAAFLVGALTGTLSPAVVVGLAATHLFGFGLVAPNVAQMALRPIPDDAGTGAAVLTALQLAFGALFGALVSALYDGHTATSTAAMMTVGAVASFIAYRFLVRSLPAVAVPATG